MVAAILIWWLIVELVGLAALPLGAWFFRDLPGRGYPFVKALGLLLLGYAGWALAMLGLAPFSRAVLIGLLLLGGVGWWALSRRIGRGALAAELRAAWRAALGYELLFAAALVAVLWLRWGATWGPGINSTEKPMDMTFLSGILGSAVFPPQDPWLAGYAINYYYLGYVHIAALARLSGLALGPSFNLGLATIGALTAQMVAGLIVALARASDPGPAPTRRGAAGLVAAASLGVLLVLVAGNQFGAIERFVGTSAVVALDGRQLADVLRQRLGGAQPIVVTPPFRAAERGVVALLRPDDPQTFDWWWPSRAVWDDLRAPAEDDVEVAPGQVERRPILQRSYAITEFPFFSFYLGDMHPHVLALPFALLALAAALALVLRPAPLELSAGAGGRAALALAGLIIGSLYAINSWDVPTYALLYAGALALHLRRTAAGRFPWRAYLLALAAVAAATLLLLAPYLLTFRSLVGAQPAPAALVGIPLLGALGRALALAPAHTGLAAFVAIFGLFLAMLLPYALATPRRDLLSWGLCGALLLVGLLVGFPLMALLPLALTLAAQAFEERDAPARAFALWASAVVALALFMTDVFYIRDFFSNRMNTIFKFYYQAWLIWGTLAGYAAWALLRAPRARLARLWALPALALLAGALVYPWATLRYTRSSAPPTIDALAFLAQEAPDEAAAIAWVEQHTRPTDVVLTAVGEGYNETGRVATATGRPTLLGWNGSHEQLWRGGSPALIEEIHRRERDIPLIYAGATDAARTRQLLGQYGVAYVYVGPKERASYPGADTLGQLPFMQLVFRQGQVAIYRLAG